jgi:hypothetical protein
MDLRGERVDVGGHAQVVLIAVVPVSMKKVVKGEFLAGDVSINMENASQWA